MGIFGRAAQAKAMRLLDLKECIMAKCLDRSLNLS